LARPPGALRAVGGTDLAKAEQVRDAARAQMAAPTVQAAVPTSALAGFITDQYILMRRHRDTIGRGWSNRLLSALRAFDGVYEPDVAAEIARFGGSRVYSRMIAMKCRGTSSLLRDVYLGADRPWGIEPDPDPPIPPEIMQALDQALQGQIQAQVKAHFDALQQQQAHIQGVIAAHAYGASIGMTPEQVDAAIPSSFTGPSGVDGSGIPNPLGMQSMHGQTIGIAPPPPIPPLPDPAALRDRYDAMVEDARDTAKRKAAEQASVAEDKLEELLAEGGFYNALAEFLVDLPLFPYACIKGPVVRIKTKVEWKSTPIPPAPSGPALPPGQPPISSSNAGAAGAGGMGGIGALGGLSAGGGGQSPPAPAGVTRKPQIIDKPILCWERVSPFDIYWTPGVSDIADANIVQRSRLTRADINDLLDLPGYIPDEVRAVLDEYGRGGIVDNWDTTDAERAVLESREDPRFNQSGLLACLEFQGNAQGQALLDMGIDKKLIPDPLRDYHCNAWLIGRHIIKVQLTPSPRKRHQYYITSFEKVPGTPVGNGLPDLLADIQTVANATLRSLVNNLSIASGPQVTVNDDRLGDGENGDELYPWKRWHVKSDPFGNNQEPAISFWQPNSTAPELIQVYANFSSLADEISAIPKFMTGSPPAGGLGRTASGLSLLMSNSAKILQTVASNIDRDIMQGLLGGLFDMVMLTDKSGILTGEEKIRILGVIVAMQRETQRSRQLEFLQLTANPIDMQIIGPKGRAEVLREVAKEIGIPGENVVPSAEAMDQQQKQAAEMAAQQQMVGHAMGPQVGPGGQPGGQPGQAPAAKSPAPTGPAGGSNPQPGAAANPQPQGQTGGQGPALNLMNRSAGGGPPIQGGPH
jgi:hypothetical protein